MNMSEKDLEILLQKNPSLKIREQVRAKGLPSPPPQSPSPSLVAENPAPKRKNKYGNIKLYEYENGLVSENKSEENCGKIIYVFDSIKEYKRWKELQLLQKSGEIKELKRQIPLLIQPAFTYQNERIRKMEYVADFMYEKSGEIMIEDVKPFDEKNGRYRLTKDFSLKWKLLKYRYPEYSFIIY